ncbi:hypothetical protein MTE2_4607 [Klebsiella pneumoniae VA360]|nr:hypothetical protein MTE2_4607 [Klebsiella pneumoniae VA360]
MKRPGLVLPVSLFIAPGGEVLHCKSCQGLLRVILAREHTDFSPAFHLGADSAQGRSYRQQAAQQQGVPACGTDTFGKRILIAGVCAGRRSFPAVLFRLQFLAQRQQLNDLTGCINSHQVMVHSGLS